MWTRISGHLAAGLVPAATGKGDVMRPWFSKQDFQAQMQAGKAQKAERRAAAPAAPAAAAERRTCRQCCLPAKILTPCACGSETCPAKPCRECGAGPVQGAACGMCYSCRMAAIHGYTPAPVGCIDYRRKVGPEDPSLADLDRRTAERGGERSFLDQAFDL